MREGFTLDSVPVHYSTEGFYTTVNVEGIIDLILQVCPKALTSWRRRAALQTNVLNEGHLDTLTETWPTVSGCAWVLPLRFPTFHQTVSVRGECSGNHVLITRWPFDPGGTPIPAFSQTQLRGVSALCMAFTWWCEPVKFKLWSSRVCCICFHFWVTLNCGGGWTQSQRYTRSPSQQQCRGTGLHLRKCICVCPEIDAF